MGSLIRVLAVLAASLVAASFLAFAVDQSRAGSETQVNAVSGEKAAARNDAILRPSPEPRVERAREAAHSSFRERIDDANDVLLSPFAGLTDPADNVWAQRVVPGVLALLLYGLAGLLVANFLPKGGREVKDWREVRAG
jgi:hypothetical protein